MAGISGQPGAKPSQIKSPVPGKEAAQTADDFLNSFENSSPPGGAPQTPSADSFLAQFDAGAAPAADNFNSVSDQPMTDQQAYGGEIAPQPGFVEANVNQFKNLTDRLKYGLAGNDAEAVGGLRAKYGDKNVIVKNGEIHVRREDGGKFVALDPKQFEIFSDLIPDASRQVVQEAAMLPAEAAGAAAGFVSGAGIGSVPAAMAGAKMARVASVPAASAIADKVSEAAGNTRDESRSRWGEDAAAMAGEAVLPWLGGKIGGAIAKRIPGTEAYVAAKAAGQKEVVALSDQSKAVVQSLIDLEKEGINLDPLMKHQIQPDSPKLQEQLDLAKRSGQFVNRQMEQAQGYMGALKANLTEIARRGRTEVGDPAKLSSKIQSAVEDLDKVEGEAIGKLKAKAMANLEGRKVPLPPEMIQTAETMMKALGFTTRQQNVTSITRRGLPNPITGAVDQMGKRNAVQKTIYNAPKDLDKAIGELGLDGTQARAISNFLGEFGQIMSNGSEARLQDVEKLINRAGPINDMFKRGSQASKMWGQFTGQLRQHRRDVIGNALDNGTDDFEKVAFNKIMDDFSMIRQNVGDLKGVLNGDMTAKSVVSSFFTGKNNLEKIRAIRSITGKESQEWSLLKEEFVNQLLQKHSSDGATGVNSAALLKDLESNYGPDFMKEVMNSGKGPNFETVKNLLNVGKRIESTFQAVSKSGGNEEIKKAATNTVIGALGGMTGKTVNGAQAVFNSMSGKSKAALNDILTQDGIEQYVANYPGKVDKKFVTSSLTNFLNNYKITDAAAHAAKVGARNAISRDRTPAPETQPMEQK